VQKNRETPTHRAVTQAAVEAESAYLAEQDAGQEADGAVE
jgi:hypothetical protein